MRTFISFNPDENTGNQILEIQSQIRKRQKPSSVEFIKWENKSKFHLTFFFLGDIMKEKQNFLISDLEKFYGDNKPGEIRFKYDGIGCFPNFKFPRVMFVNLKNEDNKVFGFYEKLTVVLSEQGFESDKKFHPHITLARIKNNHRPNLHNINEELKFDFEFSIKEFHLMESKLLPTGSVYKKIKSFSF